MRKVRVNDATMEFLKKGFKNEKEVKPVRDEYLTMRNLITYNGDQDILGVLFPTFTDKLTKSTFIVRKGEKLIDVVKSVRRNYATNKSS